jgi:hypothetical protein
MIPALKLRGPSVSIRLQPANDDGAVGALNLAVMSGAVASEGPRWWTEVQSDHFLGAMGQGSLPWGVQSSSADRHGALLRKLVVEEAQRLKLELKPGEVAWRIQVFRDQFRLDSVAAMQDWLSHAGITFDKLVSFFRAEALVEKVEQLYGAGIEREVERYRAFLSECETLSRCTSDRAADGLFEKLGQDATDQALRRRILLGILASRELERRGISTIRAEVEAMSDRFRERFGLLHENEMMSWFGFSGMSYESFYRRMQEIAAVRRLERGSASAIAEGLSICDAVKTAASFAEHRAKRAEAAGQRHPA